MAAYREQTVEVTLGPKGAFENGNIGTLIRRKDASYRGAWYLLGQLASQGQRISGLA